MADQRADIAVLLAAIEFASRKHSTQRRKDVEASPAALHDTIEDTRTTGAELEEQFGRAVRTVVEEMTDDKTLDKAVRKQLQIDHAAGLSARAKAIKLADKIAKLRDVTRLTATYMP